MCGILGEYAFSERLTSSSEFEDLLALSKHRGPDATSIQEEKSYRLGFNRLALLDLSEAGQQPKKSPSGEYHMVFNGEVYNYLELAEQYKLTGLRSTSDTEVILHLFDQIGIINTLKQLNGMFAIGVIEEETKKLYLSRDFAGIKPLFYGRTLKGIAFASQFDQIFKHPWFKHGLRLREDIVKEYFAFGYMQAPNTIYEDIYQVDPGTCLIFTKNDPVERIIIEHFSKDDFIKRNDYHQLHNKLSHAVKLQLNADRSLASFLSGGIDSSLITSIAKEQDADIEAFTMEIDDKNFNEAEFAKKYAQHIKVSHQLQSITPEELLYEVDFHFESFSEPFGDYSSLPTYLVTKKAAKFHTAMLSGDGGDELFFGYPRMYDILRKKAWFNLPYAIRTNLVRLTNKLGLTKTYVPFAKSLAEFYINKQTKLPRKMLDEVFDSVDYSKELKELYHIEKNIGKHQLQHFSRWNEFYAHMQRILIKVDRTSMKNSLEVRVPFLDKAIIRTAWASMHDISDKSHLKQPLKDLVYSFIPKKLMMQEKKGFSVPMERWLRDELLTDLESKVFDQEFYGLDQSQSKHLRNYVNQFIEKKHNNAWGVWHIYAWQKWAISQGFVNKN